MTRIRTSADASRFMSGATAEVNRRIDELGRASALELLGRLVKVTPVDTGRARGNWNVSTGSPDGSTADERRAPEALQEGEDELATAKLSRERIYVTNGLPYIAPLNNGSSRQAPKGFVQSVATGMRSFIEATAARIARRG